MKHNDTSQILHSELTSVEALDRWIMDRSVEKPILAHLKGVLSHTSALLYLKIRHTSLANPIVNARQLQHVSKPDRLRIMCDALTGIRKCVLFRSFHILQY